MARKVTTDIPEAHVNEDLEIRKETRRLDCRNSFYPLIEEEKEKLQQKKMQRIEMEKARKKQIRSN